MAESLAVFPRNSEEFDRLVHNSLPEMGNLQIVSKAYSTFDGKPAVVIAFSVVYGGARLDVQAVTTLALLEMATKALMVAHEKDAGSIKK